MYRILFLSLVVLSLLTACATDSQSVADLQSRVDALEAQIGEMKAMTDEGEHTATTHEASPFEVAVAQYVLDTAGFHAMDEALNETKMVDPAYLSTVTRVRKVVASTPWPEALAEEAHDFVTVLDDFAAALDADDGEAAATLAAEAHERQHDFSHSIDEWLGEGGHEDDH